MNDWGGEFRDKVALVTGAGRGLGRDIACAFASVGAIVAVADKDSSGACATVSQIKATGATAHSFSVDLLSPGAGGLIVHEVAQTLGRLDVLVNNARAGRRAAAGGPNETDADWDATLTVCLKAAYQAADAAVDQMAPLGGGAIVNVGSIAGRHVTWEAPSYHAAKAALGHLTRYLAVKAGPLGTRVNAVAPGFIIKDQHRSRYESGDNSAYRRRVEYCHPVRPVGTPADVAQAILFLCSQSARFVTGQTLVIDGGLCLRDGWSVLSSFPITSRQE